ncbi:hypothetical protein SAMN05421678_104101 [Actinopolymorpha cephalotaxi]|uniref:Uncharacterized protein n=1 Tax=Actinopolymorpha cephalotaxi TaxID=504797 RepID=A0A1I2PDX9_9ACTN|nr:hypothetical protein [Actinopolymorpha cephalotaxi]NYH83647.1 hypothetical protein [Actinopolymorpha cephalotaxi]SFG14284.1 hypothetical protein SAMN05421678_104101 [Actinopolymorpha cephalotaxi]
MSHLWPGFSPGDYPVAVYDGENTRLYRHPSPPEEFHPDPQVADALVFVGRHPAVVASSTVELDGVPTATVLTGDRQDLDVRAEIAHETFHLFCRQHHPGWFVDESAALAYPVEDADVLTLRQLEAEALHRAVVAASRSDISSEPAPDPGSGSTSDSDEAAAGWAAAALTLRHERRRLLADAAAQYERDLERCEGLAYYVEGRAAGSPRCLRPLAEPVRPDGIRRAASATGEAIALLLDRFAPGWQTTLADDDEAHPDDLLRSALARATPTEFGADHRSAVAARARDAVAALRDERRSRRQSFLARDDKVVLTTRDKPLRVTGFDPMNLHDLGSGDVLHTHHLKIAGDGFDLELFDCQALTEGAGDHPLFDGLRRVTFVGGSGSDGDCRGGGDRATAP